MFFLEKRTSHWWVAEGAWVVAGQATVAVIMLAQVLLLTRFLTATEYGELALGLTVTSLFGQIIFGGLSEGYGRYLPTLEGQAAYQQFFSAIKRLATKALGVAACLSVMTLATVMLFGGSQWLGLIAASCLFACLSGLNGMLTALCNAGRHRKIVAVHSVAEGVLRMVFLVLLVNFGLATPVTILLGFCLATGLTLSSQAVFVLRVFNVNPVGPESRQASAWEGRIWTYSWPFVAWGFFTFIQQSADRWALGAFGALEEVGLYSVIFQLGYAPMALGYGIAATLLSPILFKRFGNTPFPGNNAGASLVVRQMTASILLLTFILVLIFIVWHDALFALLLPEAYQSVSSLLPWMVLAAGVFSAGQSQALELMGLSASRRLLVPKIGTAVISAAGYAFFAEMFGLTGVVAVLNGSSVLYFCWVVFAVVDARRDSKLS